MHIFGTPTWAPILIWNFFEIHGFYYHLTNAIGLNYQFNTIMDFMWTFFFQTLSQCMHPTYYIAPRLILHACDIE